MKKVFGVVGLSRARACEKDKDAILASLPGVPGRQAVRRPHLQGGDQAGGQDLPHDLHPAQPVCGGRAGRALSQPPGGRPPPGAHRLCGDPGLRRLCPRRPRARRRRPARGHQRPGGVPAVRRHRLPRVHLDDRQAGRGPGDGALLLLPLHLPGGQGEGHRAGPVCSPPIPAGSPSMWSPSPPFRRSCAAPAPRSSLPSSCAGS